MSEREPIEPRSTTSTETLEIDFGPNLKPADFVIRIDGQKLIFAKVVEGGGGTKTRFKPLAPVLKKGKDTIKTKVVKEDTTEIPDDVDVVTITLK